jgi:hypothetical protein
MLDAEKEYKEAVASHRVVDSHYMDGDSSTQNYYDPSKESFLTRAGLNVESFKRAPGPLMFVRSLTLLPLCSPYLVAKARSRASVRNSLADIPNAFLASFLSQRRSYRRRPSGGGPREGSTG